MVPRAPLALWVYEYHQQYGYVLRTHRSEVNTQQRIHKGQGNNNQRAYSGLHVDRSCFGRQSLLRWLAPKKHALTKHNKIEGMTQPRLLASQATASLTRAIRCFNDRVAAKLYKILEELQACLRSGGTPINQRQNRKGQQHFPRRPYVVFCQKENRTHGGTPAHPSSPFSRRHQRTQKPQLSFGKHTSARRSKQQQNMCQNSLNKYV